jgi:hypothetical protein
VREGEQLFWSRVPFKITRHHHTIHLWYKLPAELLSD